MSAGRSEVRRSLAFKLCLVAGTVLMALSIAYGACYNCNTDPSSCWQTQTVMPWNCCVDTDQDGVYHCATCLRRLYICGDGLSIWGSPYNCSNPGATCTP